MEGLVAQGLVKWFKSRKVVDNVSLDIQRGEVVGLLGPNGAGKTTSFYMMVGLLPADGGRIFLEGDEITSLPMYQRCRMGLGYLPQESSVFRKLTVEENLLAILETLDLSSVERRERALAPERAGPQLARALPCLHALRRRAPPPRDHARARDLASIPPAGRAVHGHRSHRDRRHPADRRPASRARHRHSHHGPQCARDPRHHRPRLHPL